MAALERSRAELFLAIARRVVPEIARLDEAGRASLFGPVEAMLATKPPGVQRQVLVFLSVLRWAPVVRYGRPFEKLGAEQQDAVLHWFLRSPVAPLRKGLWGIKTLVFLGYYGRPEIGPAIGYAPALDGNARLRDA